MSARYFAYDPEGYEDQQFPQQDTVVETAPEQGTIKAFMEVYRDTANALDGMHREVRDARLAKSIAEDEQKSLRNNLKEEINLRKQAKEGESKAKIEKDRVIGQLDKMRAHRDDLNAKITKARELAASDSSDLAKQIIQVLADTKENEE